MKRRLAVIDPALGTVQGHHSAFAEMLRTADHCDFDISLWCSRQMNAEMRLALQQAGIEVRPVLDVEWYSWFEKAPTPEERTRYLNPLVRSLGGVLASINQQGPATLLYHTMDWLHALALNITLEYLGDQAAHLKHILLLMFDPGSDNNRDEQRKQMNCSLGFRALLSRADVRAFASCEEYVRPYQQLATAHARGAVRNGISMHPCFLADWARWPAKVTKPGNQEGDDEPTFLLFVGDPREDKGFLQLPKLIDELLENQRSPVKLLVQHNIIPEWADPQYHDTARKLLALAENHDCIELHQRYWSEEELWLAIDKSDLIVFNYDETKFRTKTSGVLWLAAWRKKIIAAPPETWLWREAKRLGCQVVRLQELNNISVSIPCRNESEECEHYRQIMFSPFLRWLATMSDGKLLETHCESFHMDPVYD